MDKYVVLLMIATVLMVLSTMMAQDYSNTTEPSNQTYEPPTPTNELNETFDNISQSKNYYCDKKQHFYCKHHIACPSGHSIPCTTISKISEELLTIILAEHNTCRDQVTREEPDSELTAIGGRQEQLASLPPSAGFMALVLLQEWDEELATLASLWAVSCATEDEAILNNASQVEMKLRVVSPYMTVMYLGEKQPYKRFPFCFDVSRFKVRGWMLIVRHLQPKSEKKAMIAWRNLLWSLCANVSRTLPLYIIESYRPPSESLGSLYPEEGVCMLWAQSSRLGCGQRLAREDHTLSSPLQFDVFACLYGPAPLMRGQRIYEVGPQGSWCPPEAPATAARWPFLCVSSHRWERFFTIGVPITLSVVLAVITFYAAQAF